MEKSLKYKFSFCVLLSVMSIWLLLPTFWSLYNPEKDVSQMPGWLPRTAMKLGLDLQGGIHMVLGVDLDKVVVNQLTSYGNSVQKAAEKAGITGLQSKALDKKFELEITAANATDKQKLSELITKDFSVLEFIGDTGNTLVLRLVSGQEEAVRSRAIDQSIETLRNRIDEFGVAEPVLSRKGDNQILVQFPGAKEPERLKGLIGQTAQLTFQIVHECRDGACLAKQQADLQAQITAAETKGNYNRETFKRLSDYRNRINEDLKSQIPPDTVVAFEKEKNVNVKNATVLRPFLLSTKHLLSGEYLEEAYVSTNQKGGFGPQRPVVAFSLNSAGGPLLANLTGEFRNGFMAIVLDGLVRSAPQIESALTGGSGIITLGSGSLEEMNNEARDLSIVLRAGALPASIEVQEERVIGASIGQDAISAGKSALGVASVLIFLFVWAYYGWIGLISNFVTIINVAWIFALLGMLNATLTLPGIAGIVLTIGMAVDAIIIIFERMREELRLGRPPKQIIEMGFEHAFATILDSNVTTAIGGFVLLEYGTGTIRGFALTLLVGIVVNVFMATFFLKALLQYFIRSNNQKITMGLGSRELKEIQATR